MIGPPPAIAPSDDVTVILHAAGVGTLIGTAVAARGRRRDPTVDTWLLTARWTVAGAVFGGLLVVLGRILL